MDRHKQRLVRELPQKRRPTEVAASHNWQPGAVGRHKIIAILGALACMLSEPVSACYLRGTFVSWEAKAPGGGRRNRAKDSQ